MPDGSLHCCARWSAEYLTIGPTLGESIAKASDVNRFVWDPRGVLEGGPYGRIVDATTAAAVDTGYRRGADQLWLDPGPPAALYRVADDEIEEWHPSPSLGLCA